jgi:hypothetical protein
VSSILLGISHWPIQLSGTIQEQVRIAGKIFSGTTGTSTNGVLNMSAVFWLLVIAMNIWLVYQGLSGGIEKFCQFALPAMGVLAMTVLRFGAQRFGLIIVYLGRHQRSRAIEILDQAQLRIVLHRMSGLAYFKVSGFQPAWLSGYGR